MTERWSDIPLEPWGKKYQVSDQGRVRTKAMHVLAQRSTGKDGYLQVTLSCEGHQTTFRVHRLVLMAFSRLPCGEEVSHHRNAVRTDNRLDNLEWCTVKENNEHTDRMGRKARGRRMSTGKLEPAEVFELRAQGLTFEAIGQRYGATKVAVSNMIKREVRAGRYPKHAALRHAVRTFDREWDRFRDENGRWSSD